MALNVSRTRSREQGRDGLGMLSRRKRTIGCQKCTRMNVTGVVGRGASRKTWSCVQRGTGRLWYKEENGAGLLCLKEYYWGSDP